MVPWFHPAIRSQVLMGTVRNLLADATGHDSRTPGRPWDPNDPNVFVSWSPDLFWVDLRVWGFAKMLGIWIWIPVFLIFD